MTKLTGIKRRLSRRERLSTLSMMLLVGCMTIGQCLAFNMVTPYAIRGRGRLQAKTGTGEDVSSSDPLINSYDRQEFEMQVGRAMDTLRDDYPEFLVQDLDYSIYDADLELIDPSGFHLHGVKNYEKAISLVHTLVGLFYCPDESDVKFRMCFDKARQNIRIHWNARIVPRAIFGGYKTTLHVDGISIYELDRMSGNITQHRLERLVMNDIQLSPEQGIFAALRNQAVQSQVDGIPSFSRHMEAMTKIGGENVRNNIVTEVKAKIPETILRFQNNNRKGSFLFGHDNEDDYDNRPSSLRSFTPASFSSSRLNSSGDQSLPQSMGDSDAHAALEKKNFTRKKFGLKPIDMEEFLEIEKQVEELAMQQRKKEAAYALEMERQREQKENAGGFFGKLFGKVLENTCESNYDCERPEVCCDFGIKKMCCASGQYITDGPRSREGELALVPVPITNPNPYPGDDPRNRDRFF